MIADHSVAPYSDPHQGARWAFTVFSEYSAEEPIKFCEDVLFGLRSMFKDDRVVEVVGQPECCPLTGAFHVQASFRFKRSYVFGTAVKLVAEYFQSGFGFKAPHVESVRKSWAANVKYCTKEESRVGTDFVHLGDEPRPGRRNDVELFRDACMLAATTERDLAFDHTAIFLRSSGAALRVMELLQPPPRLLFGKRTVHLFYGKTNIGKSFAAVELATKLASEQDPGRAGFVEFDRNGFIAGVTPDLTVAILDEFASHCPLRILCRLTDRWYYAVEPKSRGRVPWNVTDIILTTNIAPESWYLNCPDETREAVLRRIDYVYQPAPAHSVLPEYSFVREKYTPGVLVKPTLWDV